MGKIKLLFELYKLKNNTKKTRKEIIKIQNKKLNKLLRHTYKHSKFYREKFKNAGIKIKDIGKIPFSSFPSINKKELIENFDTLVTTNDIQQEDLREFDNKSDLNEKILKRKYHVVHSSGSTEKPSYFLYDKKAWNQMLLGIIRAALWDMNMKEIIQLLLHKPKIAYIAATDGRYGGAMAVEDGVDRLGAKQLFLDINTPLNEWIKNINNFCPNIIIGYPSAIKILGKLVEENKLKVNAKRIITCGEPLGNNLRQYFEIIFKTDIINFYGASESISLGVEKDARDGMYLFDDLNYIEIENGTMYLTSLYNFVQPIIRYQISDKIKFKEISSKIPFSRIESIVGRNEDLMWFEDDNKNMEFLHPLAIEGFCINGMKDYQFRKIDNKSFEMLIELTDDNKKEYIKNEMERQMGQILKDKKLDYVDFKISYVSKIMPNPKTGKKQLITF